jgi:hypothetical protein
MSVSVHSPPRRGGVDATSINYPEASFVGADGRGARARQREAVIVVRPAKVWIVAKLTTPSVRNKVASRFLIDRTSTPPLRGGEYRLRDVDHCFNNCAHSFNSGKFSSDMSQ